MAQATLAGRRSVGPLDVVMSCVALFAFAVSQPLLDLLGRNAEFFLARGAPPLDIVGVAVLLALVVPLGVGLVAVGVGRLHQPTGRVLHALVLAVLGGLLALQVVARTPVGDLPGWVEIGVAAVVGGLVVAAFYRSEVFRSVVRFGSIAPLVFVGLFLFASSASQLVFRAPAIAQPAGVSVGNPAPVVFVVFDEFPAASLMDGDGNLQEDVYPNFARLARDGTWFNNATTVQQQTEASIPAMITGVDPPAGKLPMAFDYPANLFTLLSDTYDIHAVEAVTELCPEYACDNQTRPTLPASRRWGTLADDLRIVAGHLFLPDDFTTGLPPIDHSWSNFGDTAEREALDFDIIARFNEKVGEDRRVPIAGFLDAIRPAAGETRLYFLHALLPHIPWNYLPSGQVYASPSPLPGSDTTGWGDDEWLVDQAHQLHLVQVQYVDTIIGRLIDRLEETGLYDDALIVVLADHGITIRPDIVHRRVALEETIGDIAAIPLFIKRPHHQGGGVDGYRAETIDVLPTIADVLEIDVPWEMDGTSLFSGDRPDRKESRITGAEGTIVFGTDGSEARAVAARKVAHFGADGPFGLAPPGHADLLGAHIDDVDLGPPAELPASVADIDRYRNVDTDAPALPALLRGELGRDGAVGDDAVVAVALNGEIVAVTRSYVTDDGGTAFYALLPPDALVDGRNDVALLLVEGTGTGRMLRPLGV